MSTNISVIIPVYNTAPYLEKCLDSLCAQTAVDIEFILIDDGSTDGSIDILKKYANRDNRFKVITQKNSGTASARNRGLKEAKGEFIGFADSDDWIEPDMFQCLYEKHISDPDADIVQCSYVHEYPEKGVSIPSDNSVIIKMLEKSNGHLSGAESLLLEDATVWNRIYRRSMLEQNNICFKEEMICGEDVYFHWTALISATKITAIPHCLYHYRRNRPASHISSRDARIFSYFETLFQIDRFVKEHGRTDLMPWINHLKLSYLAWGFERLDPQLHQEYFTRYQKLLAETDTNLDAPVAFPPLSGNLIYDLRYLILRILHPLTLKSVIHGNFSRFSKITRIRHFLSELPLKLKRQI